MNPPFTLEQKRRATERVTLLGALVNAILAVVKIISGYLGHSHGLVADGLHSLADLLADGVVLLAAKYGNQAADHDHPYGHQRIETATTVFIALFLLATAIGICLDAVHHLWHPVKQTLAGSVLWLAIAAIVINEWLYRYTLNIAKRYHSSLLKAHAWHRRSDSSASLIVSLGIVGALCGFPYLDNIAAVIMAGFILKMAYQMGRQSLEELVDQGLDQTTVEALQTCIQQVDGVQATHQLRTRLMAGHIVADVHILVDPYCSVSEGHAIADRVYRDLKNGFPTISDITIHVDAEDDERGSLSDHLPSRQALQQALQPLWQPLPGYDALQWLNCHYLNQQLELAIALSVHLLQTHNSETLLASYQQALQQLYPDSHLRLYFYPD